MNTSYSTRLIAQRKTDKNQLWVVGCSFSHGSGVQLNQRFGQLVSDNLNLPVSFLTCPGSSVSWAADQILRSNIIKNDIIVWGVTGSSRFTFVSDEGNLCHVTFSNFDTFPNLDFYIRDKLLISNHMIYDTITHIEQVINFLGKINAKLVLAFMPCNGQEHDLQILEYASKLKNSIILYDPHNYSFLDYGDDNNHPGPLQHEHYAKIILSKINEISST